MRVNVTEAPTLLRLVTMVVVKCPQLALALYRSLWFGLGFQCSTTLDVLVRLHHLRMRVLLSIRIHVRNYSGTALEYIYIPQYSISTRLRLSKYILYMYIHIDPIVDHIYIYNVCLCTPCRSVPCIHLRLGWHVQQFLS